VTSAAELVPGFQAESELERELAADPVLLAGLAWGRPRSGHPEGRVGEHVADLLRTIDDWGETGQRRADLRLMALVHDSLKYEVSNWRPRRGENHHAMRARRFAEGYTGDERLLAAIELHDRPYAIWRGVGRRVGAADAAIDRMLGRIPDVDLFLRFVELDGSTEGKNPEPVRWLGEQLERRAGGR
jgi:hypothetical protein